MNTCRICPSCGTLMHGHKCNCGFVQIFEYITLADYFRCYSTDPNHRAFGLDFRQVPVYLAEFDPSIEENAKELLKKVNALFTELRDLTNKDFDLELTSGWRPKTYSRELGLSTRSHHTTGRAVDIRDINNAKYDLLVANRPLFERKGLALEHKSATPTWLHIQSQLPRSGRTIFYP